jgi:hypothetical protein
LYKYSLAKECGTVMYSDIKEEIAKDEFYKWFVPEDIKDDTELNYCDYYERGSGYEHTVFDHGLGTIWLRDRIEGELSDKYAAMEPFVKLDWDFEELRAHIDTYC